MRCKIKMKMGMYKMMTKLGCKVVKMIMYRVEMMIMTCTVQRMIVMGLEMLLMRWVGCMI